MGLRADGRLSLDSPIGALLPTKVIRKLHVHGGIDRSAEITVRQLLAHTSGVPDYFQGRTSRNNSLQEDLFQGTDRSWTLEEALDRSRTLRPPFRPGTPGKALYSDTNYQLLGRIIEDIHQAPFSEVVAQRILEPWQLAHTYVYTDPSDQRPRPMYHRSAPLHIPRAMASFGPDGGIVSTTADMMRFTQAFFSGSLFPASYLAEMQVWNRTSSPCDRVLVSIASGFPASWTRSVLYRNWWGIPVFPGLWPTMRRTATCSSSAR